jgi:hypothetical protein
VSDAPAAATAAESASAPRNRRRSRRPDLLANAVAFVVVVVVAMAVLLLRNESRVQRNVFASMMANKLQTAMLQIREDLEPARRDLDRLRDWHRAGLVTAKEPERAARLLLPLLEPHTTVVSVVLQEADGAQFGLIRQGKGWRREEATAMLDSVVAAATAGSVPNGATVWSGPVHLPETGSRGLRLGLSWDRPDGRVHRAALALGGGFLDTLVAALPLAENGVLAILGENGQIAWLAAGGPGIVVEDQQVLLRSPRREHRLVAAALAAFRAADRAGATPLPFAFDGERWWCARNLVAGGGDGPQIVLAIPAEDLDRRLERVTDASTYVLLLLLAVGVALIAILAVRTSRRLAAAQASAPRVTGPADVRDLIRAGEGEQIEFKSTLRTNIATGAPGKEVEMSWLKTVVAFLNSLGGVLFVGVGDDGEVRGLAADRFPSEDKLMLHFNNLIKEHIGLQHARLIRSSLYEVDGREVMAVVCDPAAEPVFLRRGNDESFYVRVGPSSRKLGTSQMLEYLGRT